ncbi:hypothetical protein FH609_029200 [Streptomyces sp. 3MP-14]|uniref:Uncharacterized protein n=1 Tax=Streptomyces mimosae TaxID=2586635 RepID=A0A5N5ZM03_9ACTN|nr:hypothetical protein FH607_030725 [Streptomyces mimosae]KAB8172761.1 hypothetical protein FH609_029200 [Streptomyces sp. 3MP-14]
MLEHPRKQLKNLALTFGTLLSSQGTDASIKPLSGPSGRFPSLCSRLYHARFLELDLRRGELRFPPSGVP